MKRYPTLLAPVFVVLLVAGVAPAVSLAWGPNLGGGLGLPGWGGDVGPTSPLVGPNWTLTELNGQPPVPGTSVYIQFDADGRVAGSDGCNSFTGPYTVSGSTIDFPEPRASTLRACLPEVGAQAAAFNAALDNAATYQIVGSGLRLIDAGGATLAVFMAQDQSLAGTAWEVTGFNNGRQAVVSVLAGTSITATFGEDGRVAGSAGCNQYNASYTVDGDKTTIGPAASTRRFCAEPAGVMEQEAQFLAALQTAATYTLRGDMLELRTADGALAVTLKPAS
jgi:heat shock protein HslJ